MKSFGESARYQVLNKLGEGGMGVVYEAYDQQQQRRVALKALRQLDATGMYLFKREFRALSHLRHPNIVGFYELNATGQDWFLTMELVDGLNFLEYVQADIRPSEHSSSTEHYGHDGTLDLTETTSTSAAALSAQTACKDGGINEIHGVLPWVSIRQSIHQIISEKRLRDVLRQLCIALDIIHQKGLVHRDLKPSNVRVTPTGRTVLLDFGIVSELRTQQADSTEHAATGTPLFMAPEQVMGGRISAAADYYALGVMLYLAMSGRFPFNGTSVQVMFAKQIMDPLPLERLVPDVPQDLATLCMDLLQRDSSKRPSGKEVLARIGEPAIASLPVGSVPDTHLFVGREPELAKLHSHYAEAALGRRVCVIVEGASGVGKSYLLSQFIREITAGNTRLVNSSAANPIVLSSRCNQRENLIYKAFDGAVDTLSFYLEAMPASERKKVIPLDFPLLCRLFPTLSRIREYSRPLLYSLDEQPAAALRARAFNAFTQLLFSIAAKRPVVLCIEDIQWADAASIELLNAVIQAIESPRLLLLITRRTEQLDSTAEPPPALSRLNEADTIQLGYFSLAEQQELLHRMAQSRDKTLISQWDNLAGHPTLMTELIRYAEDVQVELTQPIVLRMEELILSRVRMLPEPAQRLLSVIAVAAEPLPLHVLAAASELSLAESERAAQVLSIAHLTRTTTATKNESYLECLHDQIYGAVRSSLSSSSCHQLHIQLARALEAWAEAPAVTLAHHLLVSGQARSAAAYLLKAAEQSVEQLAVDHAAALFRQTLQVLDSSPADTNCELLRCHALLGLAKGMRLVDSSNSSAEEYLAAAQTIAENHQFYFELATLHYLRGSLLFPRGEIESCLAAQKQALHYAQRAQSRESEARAQSGLGDAYLLQGRLQSAHYHYNSCIALCEQYGYQDISVVNLPMRGMTQFFRSQLFAGLADCRVAVKMAVQMESPRAELIAHGAALIWILLEMGNFDLAQQSVDRTLELSQRLGSTRFYAHALANQGRMLALCGQRERALDCSWEALALSRAQGFALTAPIALGTIALFTTTEEASLQALAQGQQLIDGGLRNPSCLHFSRDAMAARLRFGDPDGAEQYAVRLEQIAGSEALPWVEFYVARTRLLVERLRTGFSTRALVERHLLAEKGRALGFHVAVAELVS